MTQAASPTNVDPRVMRSRARVLQATVELLVARGIAGTSIEAVARRSGVAKTTIYRQWDSQPALVRDAFASMIRVPPPPDTGAVGGDLRVLLISLVQAVNRSPAAGLMPALIDAAERDEEFAALHRAEAEARHRPVFEVVERAVRRGELDPGTSAADVLDLLAGPVFYRRWVSAEPLSAGFVDTIVAAVLRVFGTQR